MIIQKIIDELNEIPEVKLTQIYEQSNLVPLNY